MRGRRSRRWRQSTSSSRHRQRTCAERPATAPRGAGRCKPPTRACRQEFRATTRRQCSAGFIAAPPAGIHLHTGPSAGAMQSIVGQCPAGHRTASTTMTKQASTTTERACRHPGTDSGCLRLHWDHRLSLSRWQPQC
jgi:hypothetical protein